MSLAGSAFWGSETFADLIVGFAVDFADLIVGFALDDFAGDFAGDDFAGDEFEDDADFGVELRGAFLVGKGNKIRGWVAARLAEATLVLSNSWEGRGCVGPRDSAPSRDSTARSYVHVQ
jgi:hypothetical protein